MAVLIPSYVEMGSILVDNCSQHRIQDIQGGGGGKKHEI